MKIDSLELHNIPAKILEVWRATVGVVMLAVQARAVRDFDLFGRGNLIVLAPTSSGKTFVGEMAAVKVAGEGTKVFYLVPQKALAEEKYQEFRRRYAGCGLNVVVSSRDHREFDEAIDRRAFDIAIVVAEKLQALLVARPQLVEAVGLVVVDEMQLITDEVRGPTLELLLTTLRSAPSPPRILGLSAVLGQAQTLADWLGARLLVETQRPVELRKGVLCHGTFSYREHNSGAAGTEPFLDCGSKRKEDLIVAAAAELVRRGEQVLVFLPDRTATVAYARLFANRVSLPSLDVAIEELLEHEETHARDALRDVLGNSIAFHNADLSPEERELVERHFRTGGIRALFSTTTLAMGLNLPTRNVIIDTDKWKQFRHHGGRWDRADISKSEYENMSGRAGRLAFATDFGRSILVTDSEFQADTWLRHYASGPFEDVAPTLAYAPLEDHVIDLLAAHRAQTRQGLADLLLASFTGYVVWRQTREEFLAALDRALKLCIDGALVVDADEGGLTVTGLGRACALKGLGVKTTVALGQWAHDARNAWWSELEVLTAIGLSRAGDAVYVNMSNQERYRADYRQQLLDRARQLGALSRPVFARFTDDRWSIEYDVAKALKKALFLCDWVAEVGVKDIERRFFLWSGSIRRVGGEYGWLVEGLASVAKACGWSDDRCQALHVLAERLTHGVRPDALSLARMHVRGLTRSHLRSLVEAGWSTPAALRDAGPDVVRDVVGHRGAFAALWATVADEGAPSPDAAPDAPAAAPGADDAPTDPAAPGRRHPTRQAASTQTKVARPAAAVAARLATAARSHGSSAQPPAVASTESTEGAAPVEKHELRFHVDGQFLEIDGIGLAGEIVPVLRVLRDQFLEDQKSNLTPDDYHRLPSRVIAGRLGVDDDATVRRRIMEFRRRIAQAYIRRCGQPLDAQAIVENQHRAGYRLNPKKVVLKP